MCSNDQDFQKQAKGLRTRLSKRDYSQKILKKAFQRAAKQDRFKLLFNNKKIMEPDNNTRIIMTFSKHEKNIREILNRNWTPLFVDFFLNNRQSPIDEPPQSGTNLFEAIFQLTRSTGRSKWDLFHVEGVTTAVGSIQI